jgi:hypothetical protein
VGQTGPKVADIAALLAQHQGAQGEEPPSKKRHRESWGNDCVVDYVTEEKKSPINGSRKKEENEHCRKCTGFGGGYYTAPPIVMSLLSWNCRGLGNLRIVRDLCRMVKEKKPDLVFLMETKLPSLRMEFIRVRTGFDYMFVVDNMGRSGGLALMWRFELSVEIQNYSRRHINATVQMAVNGQKWKLTGFYGHPDASKRIEAWNLLRHLHTLSPEAWLCVGDFNEITDD